MDWMIRPRARESDSAIGTLCGRVLAGGARRPRADGVAGRDPTYWLRGQADGGGEGCGSGAREHLEFIRWRSPLSARPR